MPARVGAIGELPEQTGLPDARLPDELDRGSLLARGRKDSIERAELHRSPDELLGRVGHRRLLSTRIRPCRRIYESATSIGSRGAGRARAAAGATVSRADAGAGDPAPPEDDHRRCGPCSPPPLRGTPCEVRVPNQGGAPMSAGPRCERLDPCPRQTTRTGIGERRSPHRVSTRSRHSRRRSHERSAGHHRNAGVRRRLESSRAVTTTVSRFRSSGASRPTGFGSS